MSDMGRDELEFWFNHNHIRNTDLSKSAGILNYYMMMKWGNNFTRSAGKLDGELVWGFGGVASV